MEINITTKLNLGDIVYRIMLGNLEKHIITEINIKEIKGRELVQYKTDKTIPIIKITNTDNIHF